MPGLMTDRKGRLEFFNLLFLLFLLSFARPSHAIAVNIAQDTYLLDQGSEPLLLSANIGLLPFGTDFTTHSWAINSVFVSNASVPILSWAGIASATGGGSPGLYSITYRIDAWDRFCVFSCSTINVGSGFDSATLEIVAPNPVPLPASAWVFGSALIGLFGILRRKRCA